MIFEQSANANIALIKYMGKDADDLPSNNSLSFLLDNYITKVIISYSPQLSQDTFKALNEGEFSFNEYNQNAVQRVLDFTKYIKNYFGFNGCFSIKSGNNFPHSAGIASSASSGAALTKALVLAIETIQNTGKHLSLNEIAMLSAKMSGSSPRSFFSPYCLYEHKKPHAIQLIDLHHEMVLLQTAPKTINSRTAHELIKSSPIYHKRKNETQTRLLGLLDALKPINNGECNNWRHAYEICFQEFMQMHEMFETCKNQFTYFTPECKNVLQFLKNEWEKEGDGPLITMDAGTNIHLFWRKFDQKRCEQYENIQKFIAHNKSTQQFLTKLKDD